MGDIPDLSVNISSADAPMLPSASTAGISASGADEPTSFEKLSPIQQLIVTTLAISPHLYDRSPQAKVNIRLAYARYLKVCDTFTDMDKMIASGTWPEKKKPTNDDMIEIFMAKSTWFKSHSKIFPLVNRSLAIEKWLLIADDSPTDFEVWGYQKQTFDVLLGILSALPAPVSSTKTKKGKGKGKEREKTVSEPVAVKKKKKVVEDKRNDGASKHASTSKTHHADK